MGGWTGVYDAIHAVRQRPCISREPNRPMFIVCGPPSPSCVWMLHATTLFLYLALMASVSAVCRG